MAVAYNELEKWPREEGSVFGGMKYVRKLLVAWDSRYDLVNELLYTYWPYATHDIYAPVAHEYAIEPYPNSKMGGTDGLASYDHALVTLTYTDKVALNNGTAIIEELVPEEGYNVRMSHKGLKWNGATELEKDEGPILGAPALKYILTFLRATSIAPAWLSLFNNVNSSVFWTKTMGFYFNPHMVRYDGARINKTTAYNGSTAYRATLTFTYRYNEGYGWHGVWRPETGRFENVYNNGGIVYLYPEAAFSF